MGFGAGISGTVRMKYEWFGMLLVAIAWTVSYFAPQLWPQGAVYRGWRVQLWSGRLLFEHAAADPPSPQRAGDVRSFFRTFAAIKGHGCNPRLFDARALQTLRDIQNDGQNVIVTMPSLQLRPARIKNGFGFGYLAVSLNGDPTIGACRYSVLSVPVWALLIPFAVSLLRYLRPKLQPAHCRQCGYDIRASPERCPECGTVPSN